MWIRGREAERRGRRGSVSGRPGGGRCCRGADTLSWCWCGAHTPGPLNSLCGSGSAGFWHPLVFSVTVRIFQERTGTQIIRGNQTHPWSFSCLPRLQIIPENEGTDPFADQYLFLWVCAPLNAAVGISLTVGALDFKVRICGSERAQEGALHLYLHLWSPAGFSRWGGIGVIYGFGAQNLSQHFLLKTTTATESEEVEEEVQRTPT